MKKWLILTTTTALLCGITLTVPHSYASTNGEADKQNQGVPEQLNNLSKQISAIFSTVHSQQNDIASLKANYQSDQNAIDSILVNTTNQQTKLDSLSNTVSGQQSDISALKSEVSTLQNQISSLTAQLQTVQTQLERLNQNPSNATYTIQGTMVDKSGKPFYSGIQLSDNAGHHYSVDTMNSNTGSFSFRNIPDGTYNISYYYSGYIIDSPQPITVSGSDINNVQIRLTVDTYSVSGVVTDSNGNPLSDKCVTLADPNNIGGYWPRTAADGSFLLNGIAPGTYQLQIGDTPTLPFVIQPITITSQDISGLKLIKP